ncbi:single-stranded-DNA-specific exonuclease RecJ [Halalkaliarchaeum desulfuricum]|uniref:Single-stranded-DNA-specific exonuclease RecJ n=1 Tax=Halalkaliarchaeum desulfuricum TaxID=2055893 RepID=A0A343TJS2_9EURY|nr:DHH family phosphoesterase [Halalkaliarchaeum desulfuricum]AUX09344.1 single-stranded-DNA-specific exonuclease RecJ [Halalkaliarchaeum desulfuricum]
MAVSVGSPPVSAMADRADACAKRLQEADRVLLASHIDADGLTSAAIASTALERAEIPHEVVFEKQLDAESIEAVAAREYDTVLFTDFGSGQLEEIRPHERAGAFTPVIADHHQPADAETEYHLNPLLFGIDGAAELSGAGAAYVLARAMESVAATDEGSTDAARIDNRDLAALAVVGAVGDMQGGTDGLAGANGAILEEGIEAGVIESATDLAIYGRQTRPLPKFLEYATDVRIPGITNDEAGAVRFLSELSVDLKREGDWRVWADLSPAERQTVASALIRRAIERGVPSNRVETLVGTSYTLLDEAPGTALRDVSEFSTLLNATARYERADVGLAVCLGDRDAALERARTLLSNHRRNLSEGLEWVKTEGVTVESNVQWFDAGTRIRETIVGIVAGMAIGTPDVDGGKPIVAFASKNETELKVSARGNYRLVRNGLDLSAVMREAARGVGGDGGGHDVAAGATIPAEKRDAFLAAVDELVGEQLS